MVPVDGPIRSTTLRRPAEAPKRRQVSGAQSAHLGHAARRLSATAEEWRAPGIPVALTAEEEEDEMLYMLAVILLIAWLLGVVGTYTIGAFVHVLLVIAVVLFLVGLLSGRETVV